MHYEIDGNQVMVMAGPGLCLHDHPAGFGDSLKEAFLDYCARAGNPDISSLKPWEIVWLSSEPRKQEPVFTIKPLEWKAVDGRHVANTAFGSYWVKELYSGGWMCGWEFDELDTGEMPCLGLTAGKNNAEKDWRKRVRRVLNEAA